MTLRRAYDEIMGRIEVTPEMRERVLRRVQAEGISPAKPKVLRFPAWKKYLSAAACLILVLVGVLALSPLRSLWQPDPSEVLLPTGLEDAASLEDLSALVGFTVSTPFTLPFAPEETAYCSYWNELAQIQYSGRGQTATYRQSAGTQDNSGDYTNYTAAVSLSCGGLSVTLKGENGAYTLAVWTDGTYSYSLSLSQGLSQAQWADVLN